MPYLRPGTPMPTAVSTRMRRMMSLPSYVRTHGTGDYFGLTTPMPMMSPLYMNQSQMGLTSNQAGGPGGLGCGGGSCSCNGQCGGLGQTATTTDWGFDSSAGIATMLGIPTFGTPLPIIGSYFPNWLFWAAGGLLALNLLGKK